ncbi:MAG: galactose-1-epimerase [Cardiobacteriaceae bacterium]|nr:galactose-1-epimerase [Cardiobacteriaceae bacterium]
MTTYTLKHGLEIRISSWGATWLSCRLANGRKIILGSRDLAAMLAGGAYLGCSVGRYAGRIAQAQWQGHTLNANQPPHILHGGQQGFSRRLWQVDSHSTREITLSLTSAAGDQGFPGTMDVEAHYKLEDQHSLRITYRARTNAPTPCNLTNHAYFNLNGDEGGLNQTLTIHAAHYQPVAVDGIPNAPARTVAGTTFDFRTAKCIARDYCQDEEQRAVGGYDHSFLLDNHGSESLAAELISADANVKLQLFTNQPALHLYTGQYLAGVENREGRPYPANAGIALESQYPPDSPSHGAAILQPGDTYIHHILYRFLY